MTFDIHPAMEDTDNIDTIIGQPVENKWAPEAVPARRYGRATISSPAWGREERVYFPFMPQAIEPPAFAR